MDTAHKPHASIERTPWGSVDGRTIHLWTMRNARGMEAQVCEYGALLVRLTAPDRRGAFQDVVLGRPSLAAYIESNPFFGANAGRCANRIARGRFVLDGRQVKLDTNNGVNHLHGGVRGWDKVPWSATGALTGAGPALTLRLHSPDGDQGYPGAVDAAITYTLTEANELRIAITATTDAPTVVNVAHHTYWNLAGHASGSVLGHTLQVPAPRYTPVDATMIPTGEILPVRGTPFDFTNAKALGAEIAALPATDASPGGYDINLVLDQSPREGALWLSAVLHDPTSGRTLTLFSDQAGIQIYTGNFLDGVMGKPVAAGATVAVHDKFGGVSLETQAFPDSPNRREAPGWTDVTLRPGVTYRHTMVHRFTAE